MVRFLVLVATTLLFWALSLSFNSLASAHVKDRPDLNGWFNQLKSGKGLCCSNFDGTTLADTDWEIRKGKYWVYVPTKPDPANPQMGWVIVPDEALVNEPNKYGPTVVWPTYGALGVDIRCFMPGVMM